MHGIFDKNENLNLKLIAVKLHRNNLTYRRQSALRHSHVAHLYYNIDDFNLCKSPQAM